MTLARTRAGAEAAFALPDFGRERRERHLALLALADDGARYATAPDDDGLALSDTAAIPVSGAMSVAGIAARNEVGGVVIRAIPIQMIGKQGAIYQTAFPRHGCAAPVARVWPWPELVVENESADGDYAARWGDRMAVSRSHSLALHSRLSLAGHSGHARTVSKEVV